MVMHNIYGKWEGVERGGQKSYTTDPKRNLEFERWVLDLERKAGYGMGVGLFTKNVNIHGLDNLPYFIF